MKISQKLKRSLTGSAGTTTSKKDLRRSGEQASPPPEYLSQKQPIKMSILGHLLELMGVDEESRFEIMQDIDDLVIETEEDPENHKLNTKESKILLELTKSVHILTETQQKHNAATIIQSTFRMYRTRNRLKTSGLFAITKKQKFLIRFRFKTSCSFL